MEDYAIEIKRSPEFIAIAHKVSDHLKALPLGNVQHNDLVALITEQVKEAEETAFRQGMDMGVKLAQYLDDDSPAEPDATCH